MQIRHIVIILAATLTCAQTHALSSDRDQPIEIYAQHFKGDEINQKAVYTGDVEVHQGTLDIRGKQLDLVVDKEGYRTVTIIGNPVRMKEKKDNPNPSINEWTHLKSQKAIYKERENVIVFISNAHFSRTENGVTKDETAGDSISYDLLHATISVQNKSTGKQKKRISTVLAPRQTNKQAQPTSKATPSASPMRQSMTLKLN